MKAKKQAFLQALGVSLYCILIGTFFSQANHIFPKVDQVFAPILFLILFSASALICTIIVFYKPYKLFFSGKKNEAAEIVIYTAVWLFVFAVLTFVLLLFIK